MIALQQQTACKYSMYIYFGFPLRYSQMFIKLDFKAMLQVHVANVQDIKVTIPIQMKQL